MISKELETKIVRLYHVEKWPVCTIAKQVNVHHSTIKRVLRTAGVADPKRGMRPRKIEPYLPFILDTFKTYPNLCASRIFQMVRERGYDGRPDHFRHVLSKYRPRVVTEAYLRLRTLPGEQAQVDWAHFGTLPCGQSERKSERKLVAFVMVLSWSRQIYLRFFLGQHMENFLRGHVEAFNYFAGVPRVLLYDNLKSAVLEREGSAIRFNPTILECAEHYHFEPRPVAVARGNEKGRVERAISYVRDSFFAGRTVCNLQQLNEQAQTWCDTIAGERICPEDRSQSVRQVFLEERTNLLALPTDAFPSDERVCVRVGKTPYIRFDSNDYSVPHTLVRQELIVLADEQRVRILAGKDVVATHVRTYGRHEQVEDPAHIQALVERKTHARLHRGMNYLQNATPSSQKLLEMIAKNNSNLGSATQTLVALIELYGAHETESAIVEAMMQDSAHPHSVRLILERRQNARHMPPPISVTLPDNPDVRNVVVRPHKLASYDNIGVSQNENATGDSL